MKESTCLSIWRKKNTGMMPIAKASPPHRGVGKACILRFPGRSMQSHLRAKRMTKGIIRSDTPKDNRNVNNTFK
jgi:hypothetical protein